MRLRLCANRISYRPPVRRRLNPKRINVFCQRSICRSYRLAELNRPPKLYGLGHLISLDKLQEADSNRRSQGYESCEIPLLYPAMYMFRRTINGTFTYWLPKKAPSHHATDNSQCVQNSVVHSRTENQCFSTPNFQPLNSGRRWSRTARTIMATDLQSAPLPLTEYSPKTRKPGLAIWFIVLCFPLDCFMLCQPHRVVSDIIMPFELFYVS